MTLIALYGLLTILCLLLVLHLGIVLKIVPYKVIWRNRFKTEKEMYRFELKSIIVNVTLILFIMILAGHLTAEISTKLNKMILWLMVVLFTFNTLGNLTSDSKLEKRIFAPITFLMVVFSIILVLSLK